MDKEDRIRTRPPKVSTGRQCRTGRPGRTLYFRQGGQDKDQTTKRQDRETKRDQAGRKKDIDKEDGNRSSNYLLAVLKGPVSRDLLMSFSGNADEEIL